MVDGSGIVDGSGVVGKVEPPVPAGISVFVARVDFANNASEIDVVMKIAAKSTVVRVIALAAPRPVIRPPTPPPVPKPKPPPSERCKRMVTIIAMQATICTVSRTANMIGYLLGWLVPRAESPHESGGL